jgi:large subunit ribosomal protein L19
VLKDVKTMDAQSITPVTPNPKAQDFMPGDTVRVNFRIREGERERVQAFQGVAIKKRGGSTPGANFTVRRVTYGVGIERTFPIYSPLLESVEVIRRGVVRRARLYYLRGLSGRAARIKERRPPRSNRGAQSE